MVGKLHNCAIHANLVQIYAQGWLQSYSASTNEGIYFIDMELCHANLKHYINERYEFDGGIEPSEIWHIMQQITSGLKFLHSEKIIHRDMKPENGFRFRSMTLLTLSSC